MTDKPNTPEEQDPQSDDVYEVFGDLRDTLAAEEAEDAQSSQEEDKKGLFGSLKGKFKKKAKEKDDPSSAEEIGSDEDSSAPASMDDEALEAKLAQEYLDDAEAALLEEELSDEDFDETEFEEEFDEEELVEEFDGDEALEDVDEPEPELDEESAPVPDAPGLSEKLETDSDHIRDIALEDYAEDELEEVNEREIAVADFMGGRMRRFEWAIILIIGFMIGGIFIWGGFQRSRALQAPEVIPTATLDPNVPIPQSVELPGGWSFKLGKGTLNTEGFWEPTRAEWLQGTEICKWIALPWSTQLEAVVRTLKPDDEIQLTMSNYDVLTYHVVALDEVGSASAGELNLDTPSVLLILASEESDRKWVVTAELNYETLE